MRCLICLSKAKNGYILHKRNCPDWYRPNHLTKVEMLTQEATQVLLDDAEPECGMEHPRLVGNYCVSEMNHPMPHIDLEDNEWIGNNYE